MIKRSDKSGQLAVFIIIGVLVVAAAVLVYLYYPEIKTTIAPGQENPSVFMQTCVEDEIEEAVEILSLHGGSIESEFYYTYNYENIEYLCYTNQYYVTCSVQQPLLTSHIESEIKDYISDTVSACFDDLEQSYRDEGYTVNLKRGDIVVELLPKRIATTLESELTLTKQDTEKYDSFSVILNNNLYELASIANSIVNWETTYGEAEVTSYMNYYRDLQVEKMTLSEGTKIYSITDTNSGNKFQFASRSLVFNPTIV